MFLFVDIRGGVLMIVGDGCAVCKNQWLIGRHLTLNGKIRGKVPGYCRVIH